jgi:hypothetical protein
VDQQPETVGLALVPVHMAVVGTAQKDDILAVDDRPAPRSGQRFVWVDRAGARDVGDRVDRGAVRPLDALQHRDPLAQE